MSSNSRSEYMNLSLFYGKRPPATPQVCKIYRIIQDRNHTLIQMRKGLLLELYLSIYFSLQDLMQAQSVLILMLNLKIPTPQESRK
ncbi:hypothetical protein Pcinc_001307 [Petrolisthes cinctipes]|uniref:Uncharacterized protein n=1 Tax=Petrolisthes cinctipes TaxID=88211 RepID=A0AAE1FZP8_PETCI|nr:hypothetical protein Pcinc_013150 [Petrolisthes cinctipes]KAK3883662.1 hypothetical protein Pcinc_012041 [Petrolisthes cinctipes]KAK3894950.1 hypothetical protein Pcinc_001307 [Petrolisthes cinctipes]